MEKVFLSFIDSVNLCQKTDRILLGLSGGIDSICMFHLFRMAGYPIGIAHCNFQLRGDESDEDERFVQNLANEYDIPFFTVKFNTKEIAQKEGISIQMAARDLRYDWFEELRQKYDYNYIAIAHNRNDVVETFLINLTRGSGIKGFTGIKPKIKNIIRPLLFAARKEILDFLDKNNFEYREDSSNQSTKYSRNLIRHEIIPLFEQINPKFQETIIENIDKLRDTELIFKNEIERIKESIFFEKEERKLINIEPDGRKREFVLFIAKKGQDKVTALFISPASEKGRRTLRLGDNMWLYIPNVGKPIRITSLQSVVGGVFNNSDILRLDYSSEYDAAILEETEESYVLDCKAKTSSVAYDRLKMDVDKKTMVPVTIEGYAASGMLIKTLYYKDIKEFGDGLLRPSVLETDSPFYKGSKSVMIYAKIEKKELADEVFTLNYLSKVEELR